MSYMFIIDGSMAARKYHGAGHAVAAVVGDQIVDLVYLRDVVENLNENSEAAIFTALVDERLERKVRQMTDVGEVYFGLCSNYEFNVL